MFVAPAVACEISWPPTTPRGVSRSWPLAWTTFMPSRLDDRSQDPCTRLTTSRGARYAAMRAHGPRDQSSIPGPPQPRQTVGDLGRRVGGEGEAEGGAIRLAGKERVARHERDVVLERARQQRLGVPAVGQPRPHEHAA